VSENQASDLDIGASDTASDWLIASLGAELIIHCAFPCAPVSFGGKKNTMSSPSTFKSEMLAAM